MLYVGVIMMELCGMDQECIDRWFEASLVGISINYQMQYQAEITGQMHSGVAFTLFYFFLSKVSSRSQRICS